MNFIRGSHGRFLYDKGDIMSIVIKKKQGTPYIEIKINSSGKETQKFVRDALRNGVNIESIEREAKVIGIKIIPKEIEQNFVRNGNNIRITETTKDEHGISGRF